MLLKPNETEETGDNLKSSATEGRVIWCLSTRRFLSQKTNIEAFRIIIETIGVSPPEHQTEHRMNTNGHLSLLAAFGLRCVVDNIIVSSSGVFLRDLL